MKTNAALKPDNITEFPSQKKQAKIKELHKAVIPAGAAFESKQIIAAIDEGGNRIKWKRFFFYNARLWVIYKKKDSAGAPWYFKGRIPRAGQINKSTNSNLETKAVDNAVSSWLKEADPTEAKKQGLRRSSEEVALDLKCDKLFETYILVMGFDDWDDASGNVRGNIASCRRVIKTLWPGTPESKVSVAALYDHSTIIDFPAKRIKEARKKAIKEHGRENHQAIEYAEAKARGGAAAALKQMKNLMAKERNPLKREYEKRGVILPQECFEFREYRIVGYNAAWEKYVPPTDATVSKTFEEIEKYANTDPFDLKGTTYVRKGETHSRVVGKSWSRTKSKVTYTINDVLNAHIYLLFWFAAGAGLRTKEIAQLRKDQITFVNGRMTLEFMGKGHKLAVMTMQKRAAARVKEFLDLDDSEYVLGGNWNYRYNTVPKLLRQLMRSWGWQTDKLIHQLRAYIGFKIYEAATLEHARVYLRHSTAKTTKDFYIDHFKGREVLDVDIGI